MALLEGKTNYSEELGKKTDKLGEWLIVAGRGYIVAIAVRNRYIGTSKPPISLTSSHELGPIIPRTALALGW